MTKNLITIGLDLGNSDVKVAYEENGLKTVSFPNRVVNESLNANDITTTIDGKSVVFSKNGSSMANTNKLNNAYIKEQIAAALFETGKSEGAYELNLGVGLPLEDYKGSKESYGELIKSLGTYSAVITKNEVDYNYDITVKDVLVNAENFAAVDRYLFDKLEQRDTIILDCGGVTIDVLYLTYNDEFTVAKFFSIAEGVIPMAKTFTKALNAGENFKKTNEEGEKILVDGSFYNNEGEKTSAEKYLVSLSTSVNTIINRLKNEIGSLNDKDIRMIGGGAPLVHKLLKSEINRAKVIDRSVNMNAQAFYFNAKDSL